MSEASFTPNATGSSSAPPPAPQPPIAAPSISAEQQWLQTMHPKNSSTPPPPPPNVPSANLVQVSSFAKHPIPTPPKPVPTEEHVYFGSRTNSEPTGSQVEWKAPEIPIPPRVSLGEFPQTPSQLAAQKRMQAMQHEIDTVIGMMRLDLDTEDEEEHEQHKLLSRPDKRLSELFHQNCPDYPYKCVAQTDDKVKKEKRRKLKMFCIQLGILLLALLILGAFVTGDYFMNDWLTSQEAETQLMESLARMNATSGRNETEDDNVGLVNSAEGVDKTTVTIVQEIEQEEVKATVEENGGDQETKEMWDMLTETYAKGGDVLDQAEVEEQEEKGPELFASND